MKKYLLIFSLLLSLSSLRAGDLEHLAAGMKELSPSIREHLKEVLKVIAPTPTGIFLSEHVSPALTFRTKAMAELGKADMHDSITLESLRLEDKFVPASTPKLAAVKVCYTAEILSHELLHNAQFHAGLFAYPASFSGYDAVLCERLLELQAKYTGEKMYYDLQKTEKYRTLVQPKIGFFLVMQRRGKDADRHYLEILWSDSDTFPDGKKLYRNQIREIRGWNTAYAEQAFRNNYSRFGKDAPETVSCADHLKKIIDFTGLKINADYLVKHAPVKPVPNGIACYENGEKVLELQTVPGGYIRKKYTGDRVQQTLVRIR